jgi:UDP-N-acetylglucosamine--N-acetylmuramyl-(pentapeptide) pyrophosphoryl-undecaprenol N-acetylglucosamine transferase
MDDHQAANARAFDEAGAGWAIPQSSLSPQVLAERLLELLGDGARLSQAAAQARRFGRDDAAERLAALAIALGSESGVVKKRRAA